MLEYSFDPAGNQLSQSQSLAAIPVILTQPRDAILQPGGSIRFCVVASGTGSISYQWRHNGIDLPGATGDVLVVSGLAINLPDYGDYSVVVSNGPGSSVTSESVTVISDSDADNLPDSWEMQSFGNLSQTISGDVDGDKVSNYDEWLNGSNPSVAETYLWPTEKRWMQIELGASSTASVTVRPGLPFPIWRFFAPKNLSGYGATGLPPGLSLNPGTGVLSGTPLATGLFDVALSAQTENGLATGSLQIYIPPVVVWGASGDAYATVPYGLTDVVGMASGTNFSLALKTNGTVTAWGLNDYGQTTVPTGLANVVAVAAGLQHCLALNANGTVVAWGANATGQVTVPAGLSNVVAIAAGARHSMALKSDGTVVVWGDNSFGQRNIPSELKHVVAIAAGSLFSMALRADGVVVAWGYNNMGQTNIPNGLTNVTAIAAGGEHGLALKTDGTVVAWGANASGQATVPTGLSNVVAIASGIIHSLALKADGTVALWGSTSTGSFVMPSDLGSLIAIAGAGSSRHCMALSGFGSGLSPEVVIPRFASRVAGGAVHMRTAVKSGPATFSASGLPYGLEIDPGTGVISGVTSEVGAFNVTVSATNSSGTGQGTMTLTMNAVQPYITSPTSLTLTPGLPVGFQVTAFGGSNSFSATGLPPGLAINPVTGLISGTAIATGQFAVNLSAMTTYGEAHSVLTIVNPTISAWGYNFYGTLNVPATMSDVVAVGASSETTFALKAGGTVVGWGRNDVGQLNIPSGLNNAVAIGIGGGFHALALRADGTVVAWGYNNQGQSSVPAGLTEVVSVSGGTNHSLALRKDGTVVGWGSNGFGQASPPAGLKQVIAIAAGGEHSLALTAGGLVVGWGRNQSGQITIPAGLANVVAIAAGAQHSIALKADGSVVGWGLNTSGQRTIPAGLANVIGIAAGGDHSVALKANGTVTAWGLNDNGQATVPAGLASLVSIAAGNRHTLALSGYGSGGAPELLLPRMATRVAGFATHLRVQAKNNPTNFSACGLPVGLEINPGNGIISGVAEQAGTFNVAVSATNEAGSGQQSMVLTVNPSDSQDIVVAGPSADFLRNGVGVSTLGAVAPGGLLDRAFTIGNIGGATLAGLFATIDGPDAADFSVYQQPVVSVSTGASTTLTIRFQPTLVGVKNATIHIASNDPDEMPFNIGISATCEVTFTAWQTGRFTTGELGISTISGPMGDPDSDGIANVLEYALGLDPKSPDGSPCQGGSQHIGSADYLTVSFFIPEAFANDITLVVEESPMLGQGANWTALATKTGSGVWTASNGGVVEAGIATGGRVQVTARSATAIGGGNVQGFMRIRAVMP